MVFFCNLEEESIRVRREANNKNKDKSPKGTNSFLNFLRLN